MAGNKPKSTKTTIGGWLALGGLVLAAASALLDGVAETNPDWDGILNAAQGLGLLSGGIGAWIAGIFGRDNDVSSENAKLK